MKSNIFIQFYLDKYKIKIWLNKGITWLGYNKYKQKYVKKFVWNTKNIKNYVQSSSIKFLLLTKKTQR